MPLCGDWTHATNWTTVPDVVSCGECIALLEAWVDREAGEIARPMTSRSRR